MYINAIQALQTVVISRPRLPGRGRGADAAATRPVGVYLGLRLINIYIYI